MQLKCLFIGGTHDGRELLVEHNQETVTLPKIVEEPRQLKLALVSFDPAPEVETELYRKDRLGSGFAKQAYTVFVLDGLDTIEELLGAYCALEA